MAAHFNPAVTLGVLAARRTTPLRAAFYISTCVPTTIKLINTRHAQHVELVNRVRPTWF